MDCINDKFKLIMAENAFTSDFQYFNSFSLMTYNFLVEFMTFFWFLWPLDSFYLVNWIIFLQV